MIAASGLGKRFRLYANPWGRVGEWASLGRARLHREFWAVRGVTFDLARGECLGVIGPNGSGKSTLLKLIAGVLTPTEGRGAARGRVLSILELGAGLDARLSGRENVLNLASLLNFPAGYARSRLGDIEAFAELGDFFDRPVREYSSGMRVRLAFSIFARFEPDVFLIDEALSVGDVFFQQKCAQRIRDLRSAGVTMLFVSHDTAAVLNLCDRVLLLDRGQPVFLGEPHEAVSRYFSALRRPGAGKWIAPPPDRPGERDREPDPPPPAATPADAGEIVRHDVIGAKGSGRHGAGGLRIVAARVTDRAGSDTMLFSVGRVACIHVLLEARGAVARPRCGVRLHDRLGTHVFGAGTAQAGVDLPPLAPGEHLIVSFNLTLNVRPGPYTLGLSASEPAPDEAPNASAFHDQIDSLGPIGVAPPAGGHLPFFGLAKLPMRAACRVVTEHPAGAAATGRSAGDDAP